MLLRVEKDPDFWRGVASHPQVLPTLAPASVEQVVQASQSPGVLALAAEHGGFMLTQMDHLGRCAELHTLFTPEGWGKEVYLAAIELFNTAFSSSFHMVVTYEQHGNRRSQPPVTFGFRQAGEFAPTLIGTVRTWSLSKLDWLASPARKRSLS